MMDGEVIERGRVIGRVSGSGMEGACFECYIN